MTREAVGTGRPGGAAAGGQLSEPWLEKLGGIDPDKDPACVHDDWSQPLRADNDPNGVSFLHRKTPNAFGDVGEGDNVSH